MTIAGMLDQCVYVCVCVCVCARVYTHWSRAIVRGRARAGQQTQ